MLIAICEDQPLHQENLLTALQTAAAELKLAISWQLFESGEALLFAAAESDFQLVFLDIQLAGSLNGMDTAKALRKERPQLPLIFVSNYDDYVFDGYDVGALAYIMKPITSDKIQRLLTKVATTREPAYLLANIERETIKLPLYEILYLQVSGHTLFIQTQESRHILTGNLNQYLPQLDQDFLQISRNCIINLSQTVSFNGSQVTMADQAQLAVSRTKKKQVKELLLQHYRGLAHDE